MHAEPKIIESDCAAPGTRAFAGFDATRTRRLLVEVSSQDADPAFFAWLWDGLERFGGAPKAEGPR